MSKATDPQHVEQRSVHDATALLTARTLCLATVILLASFAIRPAVAGAILLMIPLAAESVALVLYARSSGPSPDQRQRSPRERRRDR